MELFTAIEDAHGILRLKRGVHKQVKLYKRNGRVYAPHGGGYIEVRGQEHDGSYSTSHPDVRLMEYECDGISHEREVGQLRMRYTPKLKRAA